MTSFFVDVRCHPLQPNEISYNSAIHACGRGGQWELALSLLKEMRELGLSPDRISFGAMVSLGLWLSVSRESRLATAASSWVKIAFTTEKREISGLEPFIVKQRLHNVEYARLASGGSHRAHFKGGNMGVGGTGPAANESQSGD